MSNDEEHINIIRGCQQNNRKAQEALYKAYYKAMVTICLRYTKNEEDAVEVLNNGFLKVFKSLAKYCYAHSEKGAAQAFAYLPVPGKWDAAVPLEKGQKVWLSMN